MIPDDTTEIRKEIAGVLSNGSMEVRYIGKRALLLADQVDRGRNEVAQAAVLIQEFRNAAEELFKGPELSVSARIVWKRLYDAVTGESSHVAVHLLGELARLRANPKG